MQYALIVVELFLYVAFWSGLHRLKADPDPDSDRVW